MVEQFQNILQELVSSTFPEKTITIYPDDKPWFTEKLRKMKRDRKRLYEKWGKTEKYLACQKNLMSLLKLRLLNIKID